MAPPNCLILAARQALQENTMARLFPAATFAAICAITVSMAVEPPFTGASAAVPAAAATIDVYKDAN
jgi:hypothetical protein